MTRKNTDLKTLRSDLLNILGDPTLVTPAALQGAVRGWLRASAPQSSLSAELLDLLRRPHTLDAIHAALPHRRPADISRTLHRLRRSGRVDYASNFFSRVA